MKNIGLLMVALLTFSQAELTRTEDGIVKDSKTKLEWQDDYSDNENIIHITSWNGAITYCNELDLDGKGWRLPNINELKSLVVDTQFAPSIDEKFEMTNTSSYWSSTLRRAGDNKYIWGITFDTGTTAMLAYRYYNFVQPHYVRCVRGDE